MNKKVTTYFLSLLRSKNEYVRNHVTYVQDEENYYLCDGYCMFAVKKRRNGTEYKPISRS